MQRALSTYDMVLTPRGLRFAGRLWPCTIGRGGLTCDKREGDGATPRGVMRITDMLYRPDRMRCPAPWARQIRPGDLWSDDPKRPDYNMLVHAPYAGSHEAMRRGDRLYDLVLVTDWNRSKAVPGRGSAIFLHRWRRPGFPTDGCLGFDPVDLRRLAAVVMPGTRLIM